MNKNLGNSQPYTAFTLAEVLIVLAIIGVVASITIPVLYGNFQKNAFKEQLKKAFSELSTITISIKNDNGGTMVGAFSSSDAVRDGYAVYFGDKIIKKCPSDDAANARANGCFMSENAKNIDGTSVTSDQWGANNSIFISEDGMAIGFHGYYDDDSKNCALLSNGINICAGVIVDVNGPKPPNTIGKDYFDLAITKDGLVAPYYIQGFSEKCNEIAGTYNAKDGCAALVLMNIDYY